MEEKIKEFFENRIDDIVYYNSVDGVIDETAVKFFDKKNLYVGKREWINKRDFNISIEKLEKNKKK